MRYFVHLTAILLVFGLGTLQAQIQDSDTLRWKAQVSLSGRQNEGNFRRTLITPEASLVHVPSHSLWGFTLNQRYSYGTFGKTVTENDVLSRNFLYYKPQSRLYPYAMVWLQTYELSRLSWRQQLGLGLTAVALRKTGHSLKVSAMLSQEENRYTRRGLTLYPERGRTSYETYRATLRLAGRHRWKAIPVEVSYEGYFQPSIQHWENQRVFVEASLSLPLWKGLMTRLGYTYDFSSVHVKGLKPEDTLLTLGLGWRWASAD